MDPVIKEAVQKTEDRLIQTLEYLQKLTTPTLGQLQIFHQLTSPLVDGLLQKIHSPTVRECTQFYNLYAYLFIDNLSLILDTIDITESLDKTDST